MRTLFLDKNWPRKEKESKALMTPIVEWHCAKSMKDMKDKWVAWYIYLMKTFYEMENATRMDRIEAACDTYCNNYIEGDAILEIEEEEDDDLERECEVEKDNEEEESEDEETTKDEETIENEDEGDEANEEDDENEDN